LALNQSLATAYDLKEDLRQFWEQPGKTFGTLFLDGWIQRAASSGIKMLQQMAKTLAAHRSGLLAYYDVMITSGPLEGTNNKIKTMKRQAYGFRDHEFFKLTQDPGDPRESVRASRMSTLLRIAPRRALPPEEPLF
jgi:transposase